MRKFFLLLTLFSVVSATAFSSCPTPPDFNGPTVCPEEVEETGEDHHLPSFAPPVAFDNQTDLQIFYCYEPALKEARENNKLLVIVFFSKKPTVMFQSFFRGGLTLGSMVDSMLNIVVLQPSLISPLIYPPRMDPMIGYITDFQESMKDVCSFEEDQYIFIIEAQSGEVLFSRPLPSEENGWSSNLDMVELLKEIVGVCEEDDVA